MSKFLVCSECFNDHGLKIMAYKLGVKSETVCPNCSKKSGYKLDEKTLKDLAYNFYVRGSMHRVDFGIAPVIQFNRYQYQNNSNIDKNADMNLIEDKLKIGFFLYAPKDWMVGINEKLKELQQKDSRKSTIMEIIDLYQTKRLTKDDNFFRLRKNPSKPKNVLEYDAPPLEKKKDDGRFDFDKFSVMYASQDLEVCLHESRVMKKDSLYLATLSPNEDLKLLDLTEIIEDNKTPFESINQALYMLFLEDEKSYEIIRDIAKFVNNKGYDGIIYPSYFSLLKTRGVPFETVYGLSVREIPEYKEYAESKIIPNIAIFGHPIKENKVKVKNINKLNLKKVEYDFTLGPVNY
jgi:hypothetical protein